MDVNERLERTLSVALSRSDDPGCPPTLRTALVYAVSPAGHRIRPKLSLAVAQACGFENPKISLAAAASIELLHCASLVHDDLPAFDNADIRRGKPSLHRAFGEQVALLAGDALIVMAFETLALESASDPGVLAQLVQIIAASVGAPRGIVAGQAWESEQRINLANYHQEKTGALFAAATMAGAASCNYNPEEWRHLGITVGESYQIADDIRDVCASSEEIGKPTGQDEANNRPNIAREMGVDQAVLLLKRMISEAIENIPGCPLREKLQKQIAAEGQRFLPESMRDVA
tara:strand:+ start:514 stop:1380 length:867 start_codon:yes stop_codon:yes gene_type:complete